MFEVRPPSGTLPPGKDGIIVLGVNLLGEAMLASTKLYNSELNAWVTVDQGILHHAETVENFMLLHVAKTDVDNCYIAKSEEVNGVEHMLCINASYIEKNDFDVYFSEYSPFFIYSIQSPNSLSFKHYKVNEGNFMHYRNYKEAVNKYRIKAGKATV